MIIIRFAPAVALLALTTLASASEPPPAQQLEALVQQSLQAKPACEDFDRSVQKLIGGLPSDKPLPDRASALKLLELVSRYPGTPSAAREAFEKTGQLASQGLLTDELVKIEMGAFTCNIVRYHQAMSALLRSVGPLRLSKKERGRVTGILLDRIRGDIGEYSPLIALMIHSSLLTTLIDERVADVSDALFVETLHWNDKIQDVRSQVQQAARKSSISPETIGLEFRLGHGPAESLVRIANRIARVPAS